MPIGGTYIKGKGYTPIFVCVRYASRSEIPVVAVGAALSFDEAMRYANGDISIFLEHGYAIDTEIADPNGREEDYTCVLLHPNGTDWVQVRVNKCALLHN